MNDLILRLNEFSPHWAEAMWCAIWQGGLAIAIVWLLCLMLPKTPARIRCWWWRLALAKLLISLVWTTPIQVAVLPAAVTPTLVASTVQATPVLPRTDLPMPMPARLPQTATSYVTTSPHFAWKFATVILAVWSLGLIVGALGIIRKRNSVRLLIRNTAPVGADHPLQIECVRLSQHFGLQSVPEVRVGEDLSTPVLAGFRHPSILVPESFLDEKPPRQLRMMLAHELAHVKRRALGWAWLAIMARWFFFFHPLVWIARKEIGLTEEMAADDLTLSICQLRPVEYAGMLVEVAGRLLSPRQEELVVGVASSHQTLKRRLEAMKHLTPISVQRLIATGAIVTTLGLVLIVPWRLTAQESLPGIPVTQRISPVRPTPFTPTDLQAVAFQRNGQTGSFQAAKLNEDGTVHSVSLLANSRFAVVIDAAGNYHSGDQVVPLDKLLSILKYMSTADPTFAVEVQADQKTPYHPVRDLLDGMLKAGVKIASLANSSHTSSNPQPFDIAFGVWRPAESTQTGPAAAGHDGDYWNAVGIPWNNDHTESELKFTSGEPSPIRARLVNLGGGWGNNGHIGVHSPMMDSYNYPQNNQGGNSEVILTEVPRGKYDLYIYGHELDPVAYGDYTLSVGNRKYGRKTTSNKTDAVENKTFVEGSQYVKFAGIEVTLNDAINIFIRPGGQLGIGNAGDVIQATPAGPVLQGAVFSDTVICGLQLIPVQ